MKVRKQVYELTLDDLQSTPVWEFALDEEGEKDQDEATVRPFDGSFPVDPGDGMFVIRAKFRLADGTPLSGYLNPPVHSASSVATIQPIIITPNGQVMFWYGIFAPKPDAKQVSYSRLGKKAHEIFPVSYESDVPLVGGPVRGSLNGFGHFRGLKDESIVEVP